MSVVKIVFEYKAIQKKWFGTHAGYDKTDVATIPYKKSKMELKKINNKKQYTVFNFNCVTIVHLAELASKSSF